MEQLDYNLLYRWFVRLSPDDPVWDPTPSRRTATGCRTARASLPARPPCGKVGSRDRSCSHGYRFCVVVRGSWLRHRHRRCRPSDVSSSVRPKPRSAFRRPKNARPTTEASPADVALASQDVEDDLGGVDALRDRLGASAGSPSVSTAVRMSTICRLPWSALASLRRTRSIAAGSTQSLSGRHRARRRACERAPARNARGRRSSRRDRRSADVRRQSGRPGGSRCDRHRPGPRPGARPRRRPPSTCCCRSAPARSWRLTPVPRYGYTPKAKQGFID
jgi:hypothetical protein